jgi:hypothetical protein
VLLIHVVESSKREHELILLGALGSVADIESIVGFLRDRVRQTATFEGEAVIGDSIEADRGWHLSLILENDRHDAVLTDAGLAELKSGCHVSSFCLSRLLNLESWQGAFTTEFENELAHLGFWVSIVDDGFKYSSVLHHSGGREVNGDILVLVRLNSESLRLYLESEAFRLALSSGLHFKLDCARNLVGVHNLELLFSSFGVLGRYESSEPEDVLLDREEARADDSLSVDGGVKRGDHGLLFEDLLNVLGVDSRVRALSHKLEGNSFGHDVGVSVGDV